MSGSLVGADNKFGEELVGQRVEVTAVELRVGTRAQVCLFKQVLVKTE